MRCGKVADAGDEVAREIYERGGRELGQQVAAVVERTGLAEEEFPLGLIGSVFHSGEVITGPLCRQVAKVAPGARIAGTAAPRWPAACCWRRGWPVVPSRSSSGGWRSC